MIVDEALIKTLETIGVDHVFVGPGNMDGILSFVLQGAGQLKTVLVRNEQAASFMACGYTMFSDKLGVCVANPGPGAFNLMSGLAVALSDSLPVLAVSGLVKIESQGKGALNESSGLSRTPDSRKMFDATTKKSFVIEHPDQTCDILEEAINLAFGGRPGPVHIHIRHGVGWQEVTNFREIKLDVKPVLPTPKTVEEFGDRLAKAIKENEQIVAYIGHGGMRSHAEAELLEFVEKFQIPFMTTMDGKGVLPENHPLSLGIFGTVGDPGAIEYFDNSTLVLAMGNSFAQNATFLFKPDLFEGKTLMHINIDEHEIGKVYNADYGMVSDLKPAIIALTTELSKRVNTVEPKQVIKKKWYDLPIEYAGDKIHPGELVKLMSKHLPKNSIVLGDAGGHMLWLNCYLELANAQKYQNPGSFGPMAAHVNGAIGVKCANPDKTVICGTGDGSYALSGFELTTAIRYNIPVVWVVFNNGELNASKMYLVQGMGKHALMEVAGPNYAAYAQTCGAQSYKVTKLEDFEEIFQKALQANEPVLIEALVESEVYPPYKPMKQ